MFTKIPLIRRLLFVALMLPLAASAETREAMANFFDQHFGNLQEEAATAKTEGKKGVLIMFVQADCPWCDKMKNTVLNQSQVQDYFHRYFRVLHLDIKGDTALTDFSGKETTEKDFSFAQRVRATPVFAFFGTDGKLLTKYTGATKDPSEFLWLGEFVVNGDYKNKNFTLYKRERASNKT